MNIKDAKKVHFIGVGGIGMSALAQLLISEGKHVSGSDREDGKTLDLVRESGGDVSVGDNKDNVSDDVDVVIYSDAVGVDSEERKRAKELGIKQLSYFEALGEVSSSRFTIAVSGTHGKTTTTGILTKILFDAAMSPTSIVGSIMSDFGSNFISGDGRLFVVEACEYKDHILELSPKILVVTNIEFDHSDFFKDLAHVQKTFKTAIDKLGDGDILVTNPNDASIKPLLEGVRCKVVDYTKEEVGDISLKGGFNLMNAKAAVAAARAYKKEVKKEQINKSLQEFKGTWRRFEFKGNTLNGAVLYDDYAHHPSAVKATLEMVQNMFEGKRIVVVFHPHLHSRTKEFFEEFASSLSIADKIGILPIFRARAEEDFGVSSELLVDAIKSKGVDATFLPSFIDARSFIDGAGKNDVVITMGAGDVYKVADEVVENK